MRFQINQDSAVIVAFAESKVIDAQYLRGWKARQGQPLKLV
jgi:hypothetical protein